MSKSKGGFADVFFNKVMPMVYGLGGAVVIVGALFKIMHWPGAGLMLIIGLGTEALIFVISAFQPVHKDPDWARVYPQLADNYDEEYEEEEEEDGLIPAGSGVTRKLDDMLADANINEDVIGRLGQSFEALSTTVSGMKDITDASVASNEYANNVKTASQSLLDMNSSYARTAEAMAEMANASTDAKEYHAQVQNITKNLGALNAVYEMELSDANNHIRAMNKFYSNLSSAMENMADASKDTEQFREELGKLSKNLTSLNNVYGNMLTAMKG
ncbi:gliding motility protein GldL [Cytophagaceae bacterium ABcell3]|nr:gliding motility protein GldL [Cytophagaceae bacterium ABcell3]